MCPCEVVVCSESVYQKIKEMAIDEKERELGIDLLSNTLWGCEIYPLPDWVFEQYPGLKKDEFLYGGRESMMIRLKILKNWMKSKEPLCQNTQ